MLKELQSLGLDVIVQDKDGNEIDMRQNFDEEETGFDMREVAGAENVVQESEAAERPTPSRTPTRALTTPPSWRITPPRRPRPSPPTKWTSTNKRQPVSHRNLL